MHDDLSELAQHLGRWVAERCTDGLPGQFGDELGEGFPGEGSQGFAARSTND